MNSDKLPFNPAQLDDLREKLDHLKQANTDLSTSVPESWHAFEKYKDVLNQTSDSAAKSEASHAALGKTLGSVGKAVPELSGAMEALQGLTEGGAANAVLAIAKAWEIYQGRVEALTQALSQVQMPDLTAGITQATQLAANWNGVAEAIQKANQEFNSVEHRNNRNKSADEKAHDQRKQALKQHKEQELANLELQKGNLTPAQYQLNQAAIENEYTGQEANEDQRFDQQKLQRKEQYQQDLQKQAQADTAKAAAIKLPESQAVFDAQQKAMQDRADTLGATKEKALKEAEKLRDNQSASQDGVGGFLGSLPGWLKMKADYGLGAKRDDVIKMYEDQAKDMGEQQTAVLKVTAQRETAKGEKSKLLQNAAREASESKTVDDELHSQGGDVDQFRADTQNRRATTQARLSIDTTKAVAEATDHGQNVMAAFDALHRAHTGNWDMLQKQLQAQAEHLQELKGQLAALPHYSRHQSNNPIIQ